MRIPRYKDISLLLPLISVALLWPTVTPQLWMQYSSLILVLQTPGNVLNFTSCALVDFNKLTTHIVQHPRWLAQL